MAAETVYIRSWLIPVSLSLAFLYLIFELRASRVWLLEQEGTHRAFLKTSGAAFGALGGEVESLRAALKAAENTSDALHEELTDIRGRLDNEAARAAQDREERRGLEEKPLTTAIDFGCRVPQNQRLQARCWLSGARGNYTGEFNAKRGLVGGRSQSKEDLFLLENFFFGKTGGTFLEMGGLDGLMYSNTYYFEAEAKWNGIMIEGSPKNFESLVKNRPDAININAMVCGNDMELHWVETGNAIGGAWEFMTNDFRKTKHPDLTDENVAMLPTVPCVSLSAALSRFGVRHVDIFSLDVEGAEASVLKTLNFDTFSASVILVETKSGQENPRPLLLAAGYIDYGPAGPNRVYLHPRFKETL